MTFDTASLDLKRLFTDKDMFDSRKAFRKAGFDVIDREHKDKIMVATHGAAPGYMFKKYSNDTSPKDQLEKYEQRVEGARKVRALIEERRLEHIVVPQKAVIELPREFSSRKSSPHVVIAERLSLSSHSDTKRTYSHIDENVLRDLCVVLHVFPGLDSVVANMPFTKDGKIAFIDTEHWGRRRDRWKESDRPHLRHVHLSDDRMKFAKKVFKKLEEGRDARE
jgi:hypothetical protein